MRPRPLAPLPAPLIVLGSLLASSLSVAQLAWETTQVEMTVPPGQTNLSATFRFRNESSRPVTLFGLKDGCGCSTSNLVERSYAPNDSGEFTLGFPADGKPGLFVRHATLQTDDPYRPNVYLAIEARVPEILVVRPATLQWRVGQPASEKSATITLASAPGITIDSITVANPELFSIRCEGEGLERRLTITPSQTDLPARATIRIDVRFARNMRHSYHVHAVIGP